MSTDVLTADQILDAAEEVLRRYGPAKATVLDVARALGVSHGSVYRHFTSKAALRDAVARRWLARITAPLADIATAPGPAAPRLRQLVVQLSQTKRRMAEQDPELFATFHLIVTESGDVVGEHLGNLAARLATVIADGIASGEFTATDPAAAGRVILQATARFHHPAHVSEWADPAIVSDLEAVLDLLLQGLRPAR